MGRPADEIKSAGAAGEAKKPADEEQKAEFIYLSNTTNVGASIATTTKRSPAEIFNLGFIVGEELRRESIGKSGERNTSLLTGFGDDNYLSPGLAGIIGGYDVISVLTTHVGLDGKMIDAKTAAELSKIMGLMKSELPELVKMSQGKFSDRLLVHKAFYKALCPMVKSQDGEKKGAESKGDAKGGSFDKRFDEVLGLDGKPASAELIAAALKMSQELPELLREKDEGEFSFRLRQTKQILDGLKVHWKEIGEVDSQDARVSKDGVPKESPSQFQITSVVGGRDTTPGGPVLN